MKSNILKPITLFLLLLAVFISCKKRDIDMLYAVPSPGDITISTSKEKAEVSWGYKDERAQSFTIELSETASFSTILSTKTVKADSTYKVIFSDLKSKATYYVRLRTLTGDPIIDSRYSVVPFVSAEIENVFLAFGTNDIKATSVVFTWKAPAEGTVSHIILTPVGGTALPQINLTSAQVTARTIEVLDLTPGKNYKAEIFGGTERKGIIEFKTKDLGAAITINNATLEYANLAAAITAAVSGDIIKLTTGTYDYAGQTLTISGKSLTIQAKTATDVPVVKLRNFALAGDVGVLKFAGLTIQSAIIAGATDYEKHMFGGTYVSGLLDLQLENCNLSGSEAGLFFTQTVGAATAPSPIPGTGSFSVTVNNCLLHDFGAAGGDFIDFRSGTVAKVQVKNSTIWAAARSFFRIDATANASGNTMLFENNTFNAVATGAAFIRVATAGCTVQLTKNIITNKPSSNNNTVSGAGTTLKFNDNNVFGTNAASITSVITSGFNIGTTNLDPQYANAATGSFTVGNATVKAAGAGDPRWL